MKTKTLFDELVQIIEYIEDNLLEITSLDQCIKNVNLSKYHAIHVFKKMTGYTIMDYIQSRKMALTI